MKYRLGLDVGTNSLGWSVLRLDAEDNPCAVEMAGSRIFSDGRDSKSKATLAADRREARSARRRRDRYKQRRAYLLAELTRAGLFPEDKTARAALQKLNPLELRARLLTETATAILADLNCDSTIKPEYLVGRALFHLNQRRGFQSNRKERDNNEATTTIAKSINKTNANLKNKGMNTIGEYLWLLNKKGEPSRARGRNKSGDLVTGAQKVEYHDLYVGREMLKDELDKIWKAQIVTIPKGADKAHFHDIIFFQRPLKAQESGMCQYMPNEKRGAKALPSIQQHRIYQDLNNLAWGENEKRKWLRDNPEGYAKIEEMLLQPTSAEGKVKFNQMREALKNLEIMQTPEGLSKKDGKAQPFFNLEKGKGKKQKRKGKQDTPKNREHLYGDKTSAHFGHEKSPISEQWQSWNTDERNQFVLAMIEHVPDEKRNGERRYKTDEESIADLSEKYGLTEEEASTCVRTNLDKGYADLSAKAATRIAKRMKGEKKLTQREAVQEEASACLDGSFNDPYELVGKGEEDKLRYYGAVEALAPHIVPGTNDEKDKWNDRKFYGGVTNPTVHIALNQIRQVVNELIDRNGHPDSIAIELGRNLPIGQQKRKEKLKKQIEQQKQNDVDKRELRTTFNIPNPSRGDIRKLRLWKEAERRCPFCYQTICCSDLFGTPPAEIEHLIPQSIGGQDNWGNLTISCHSCNAIKSDQTPYEAFGDKPDYNNLPEYKHWRFQENAREILLKVYGGFLNRHLNDTRYIGRIAKAYLGSICADKNIIVVTGELTHGLRKYWKLDSILDDPNRPEEERGTKNRNDHRHHAVDAIVVGKVTRTLIQSVASIKERNQFIPTEKLMDNLVGDDKQARENFLKEVKFFIEKIIVSHKTKTKKLIPGQSTDGQLHNDTAYGIVAGPDSKDQYKIVTNRKVDYLIEPKKPHRHRIISIRDEYLRTELLSAFDKKGVEGVTEFVQNPTGKKGKEIPPIRSLRCFETEKIKKINNHDDIENILDLDCRKSLLDCYDKAEESNIDGLKAVNEMVTNNGFKDKLWKVADEKIIFPRHDKGKPYKVYKPDSNWGIEIYEYPKNHERSGEWDGFVITRFEANQPDFQPGTTFRPVPTARLVMRLQIGDYVEIVKSENDKPEIMRVEMTSYQRTKDRHEVTLSPVHEANTAKRHGKPVKEEPFSYTIRDAKGLKKFFKAHKIHISPTGQINRENRNRKKHGKKG